MLNYDVKYSKDGRIRLEIYEGGLWRKYIMDSRGNTVNYTDSYGHWSAASYDELNRIIFRTNSYGEYEKKTYDSDDNIIFLETHGKETVYF
jgi:uncharacterized protein RhaS with RHS repeats